MHTIVRPSEKTCKATYPGLSMSPAKRGVGVSGADRIAMTAFAVDVRTGMFGDRVVTGQQNRARRDEAGEDRRNITARQGRKRPAVA
jgi:hypothetical protein